MGDSMATKQAYVQVKGLKKHYGDGDARLTVLDGIDTSINRGGSASCWGLRVRASRRFLT